MNKIAGYNGERVSRPRQARTMDELTALVWKWFDDKKLDDPVMQTVKVIEEVGELAHEISRHNYDTPEVVDALGDSFVTIIGVCHHLGIDPATALDKAYNEIKNRKGKVVNGSFVKDEKNNIEIYPLTNPLLYQAVKAEEELKENFTVNGKTYLVRCPKCKKENWALNVSSGICAWCGYDANGDNNE